MIAVAGNVHEKFRAGLRRIQELEEQRKCSHQQAALREERGKLHALEQFVRRPQEEFSGTFGQLQPRGRARPSGQSPHGRSQPAPGGLHRQEIRQSGPGLSRSDSGRQSRAAQRGREIRISARLQVFHLCGVVDSPGVDPLDCRPGPHDSHPGAHDRDHDPALAGAETDQPGTGARAHGGRPGRRNASAGFAHQRVTQDGPPTGLARRAGGRRWGRERGGLHRRQERREPVRRHQPQHAQREAGPRF